MNGDDETNRGLDPPASPPDDAMAGLEPSDRALRKLRGFMLELDPDERSALARLIAPGVEQALEDDPVQEWTPDVVQRWLKGADGRRRRRTDR